MCSVKVTSCCLCQEAQVNHMLNCRSPYQVPKSKISQSHSHLLAKDHLPMWKSANHIMMDRVRCALRSNSVFSGLYLLSQFLLENPFPCGTLPSPSGAILPTPGCFHKPVSMTGMIPVSTQTEIPEICLKMHINWKDAKLTGGRVCGSFLCLEPQSLEARRFRAQK